MKSEPAKERLNCVVAGRPLVIGHRGFCSIAPENTLPSFELAISAGADLVELDYRHTADGVPVVIHDAELDRTTDARKRWKERHVKVAAKTIAQIKSLDAGSWFDAKYAGAKVPTLAEALETIQKGSLALIERKAGDPATCLRVLREMRLINRVIVQSFDWEFLRALHEQEPELVLGALGPPTALADGRKPVGILKKLNGSWLDELQKTGASIAVWDRRVSKDAVSLARERGLRVWVYTINDVKLARRLVKMGVAGLITNDPRKLMSSI
jgi:glycerophosphoryl diester phosphodiesterase